MLLSETTLDQHAMVRYLEYDVRQDMMSAKIVHAGSNELVELEDQRCSLQFE